MLKMSVQLTFSKSERVESLYNYNGLLSRIHEKVKTNSSTSKTPKLVYSPVSARVRTRRKSLKDLYWSLSSSRPTLVAMKRAAAINRREVDRKSLRPR